MSTQVIAIDGPAGAGKSTVAKAVASELGFTYLDTGAMYRAVALLALRRGVWKAGTQPSEEALGDIANDMDLQFLAGMPQRVIVNGEDVTEAIRTMEIGEASSAISAFGAVRRALVARQQALIAKGKVVLEGRDTTTVVCPDAELKVYLTASVKERARRRLQELIAKNQVKPGAGVPTLEEIEEQISLRDNRDMTRDNSPLRVAEGAVVIDTDNLTPDEAVAAVLASWREAELID